MSPEEGKEDLVEKKESEEIKNPESSVTLSKEEYSGLMSKLTEMSGALEKLQESSEELDLSELNPSSPPESPAPVDIENMPRKEFAQLLHQSISQPLVEMMMTMQVQKETEQLETKYGEDFTKVADEVFKVAQQKPSLSMQEALRLVKPELFGARKEEKKPSKEEEEVDKKKASSSNVFGGERSGVNLSTVSQDKSLSIGEASQKALEEISEGG